MTRPVRGPSFRIQVYGVVRSAGPFELDCASAQATRLMPSTRVWSSRVPRSTGPWRSATGRTDRCASARRYSEPRPGDEDETPLDDEGIRAACEVVRIRKSVAASRARRLPE